MNKYNILLGQKIKILRKRCGYTQEKFAELVNRSKNHISKIELGTANPPVSLIFDIANVLGIEPHELFLFHKSLECHKNIDFKKELNRIENKKHLKQLFQIYKILYGQC